MERHALLRHMQRQHQFAQNMLPRHPLASFVTGHNPLPRTLGLSPAQPVKNAPNHANGNKLARRMMPTNKSIQASNSSTGTSYALSQKHVGVPANVEANDAPSSNNVGTPANMGAHDALSLNNGNTPLLNARTNDALSPNNADTRSNRGTNDTLSPNNANTSLLNGEANDTLSLNNMDTPLLNVEPHDAPLPNSVDIPLLADASSLAIAPLLNVGPNDTPPLNNVDIPLLADAPSLAIAPLLNVGPDLSWPSPIYREDAPPDKSGMATINRALRDSGHRDGDQSAQVVEEANQTQQNVESGKEQNQVAPIAREDANINHQQQNREEQPDPLLINQILPGIEEEQHGPEANPVQQHAENQGRHAQNTPAEVIRPRRRHLTEHVRDTSNGVSNDADHGQAANTTNRMPIRNRTEPEDQPVNSVQSETDALFAPRETPRSSVEWLDMLRHSRWGDLKTPAAEPVTPVIEPVSTEPPTYQDISNDQSTNGRHQASAEIETISADRSAFDHAEPLSMRTRRFLRPLIGFDPVNVRVQRGSPAARLTAAHRADAVTLGDDIALAAGYPDDQPQTLGLLAHELTHVARHHEPRFVPPVVSGHNHTLTNVVKINSNKTSSGAPSARRLQDTANEEALAEHVEQQVTSLAREERKNTLHHTPGLVDHASAAQWPTVQPSDRESNTDPSVPAQQTNWGGLPAPWEPLPDWFASSSQAAEQSISIPDAPFLPQSSSLPGNIGSNGATTAAVSSTVQRAGTERSQHTVQAHAPEQTHESNIIQSPEPDLDELAQQVYGILKRKFGVERRRMS